MSNSVLVLLVGSFIPALLGLIIVLSAKVNWAGPNRLEPFECGFEAMDSVRTPFSLKFFMVVVIFLVFDVEVVLVLPLPLAKSLLSLSCWGWVSVMLMVILILGLVLEFTQGVFEWSD